MLKYNILCWFIHCLLWIVSGNILVSCLITSSFFRDQASWYLCQHENQLSSVFLAFLLLPNPYDYSPTIIWTHVITIFFHIFLFYILCIYTLFCRSTSAVINVQNLFLTILPFCTYLCCKPAIPNMYVENMLEVTFIFLVKLASIGHENLIFLVHVP